MTPTFGYNKLKVWEKAHALAVEIYTASKAFPKEEIYGLTSQLRRAAFSVPLNIVEGHASNSRKEFLNFLNIANRSLVETEYLLQVTREINILDPACYVRLERLRSKVAVILAAFRKSVKAKSP
jgi:four helix bundle protein